MALINSGTALPTVSDERILVYWLASSGSGGLARQEIKAVTSSDAVSALGPSVSDEASYIIAPEVRSVTFRYLDNTQTWNDTWDGTTAGADGVTPMGPPMAIEVILGIGARTVDEQTGADVPLKNYRRVVFLPTANGVPVTAPNTQ